MAAGPDISYIIVNWNGCNLVRKCLTVLARDDSRLATEAIVVDNGSTDGSVAMVESEFPEVTVIATGKNLGFAQGNNVGIRASRGRYVCLMNSDIEVEAGCGEALAAYLDENPDVGMVGPMLLNTDGSFQQSVTRSPCFWRSTCRALGLSSAFPQSTAFHGIRAPVLPDGVPSDVEVLIGAMVMARRKAIERIGLLNEQYFMYMEDIELSENIRATGWRTVYLPAARASHHIGGSSRAVPLATLIRGVRSQCIYWKVNHGLPVRVANIAMMVVHQAVRVVAKGPMLLRPARRDKIMAELRRRIYAIFWIIANCGKSPDTLVAEGD